jgi:hypothetical protein
MTKMKLEDRIALHHQMAEAYRDGYLLGVHSGHAEGVHSGRFYELWQFTDDAVYLSPYFTGDQLILLRDVFGPGTEMVTTMEARAYSVKFPEWSPVEFKVWAADNGFTMRVRWEGTLKDGTKMGFYSIGFVETNDEGKITRWETHVNDEEYGRFLDVAIGGHGPFKQGADYVELLTRVLKESGQWDEIAATFGYRE